ncbi:zinc finger BED domain-containing protein 1-like [Archocentrus centrarchus]|uniref:zinc finger BED domain-containing protein 1-like n=1 Tax=Archocentrus centrarchus TaxID=63155 RepID=UPI0011E9E405|nr:zinc finger BED domain-containing protein 1-like [Archocentrus centrarchus]
MLRHYRAKHENTQPRATNQGSRKQALDEALEDFTVKDSQPFTVVDDSGFRVFVAKLDPTYTIPSTNTVKATVEKRHVEEKEKAKAELLITDSVSLTADMWTSINIDAYLAVTCHFVGADEQLSTTLLGVHPFPRSHTAENIAAVVQELMVEWGIGGKVRCLVTDAAQNMTATARILKVRHAVCIAHALNLIVKKSIDATPGLDDIRSRVRRTVAYFKSSTTAKECLQQVQVQMGRPVMKLMQEVETWWNSTFEMLQQIYDQREAVAAALATLSTDLAPLTANEYEAMAQCIKMLSPFQAAAVELSQERKVSASKVAPLIRMLKHTLNQLLSGATIDMAKQLGQNLDQIVTEKLSGVEMTSLNSMATLLDPRFKTHGFHSPNNCDTAVKRLKGECAALMKATTPEPSTSVAPQPAPAEASTGINLWKLLDNDAEDARKWKNATADAIVEVQQYLPAPPLGRAEDPLKYWAQHKTLYPNLYHLAKWFLVTPASSVPCERVFSKAGEIVSKKETV